MISTLTSTDSRFKTLEFRDGLNILVADQHERATDADTRNGVGKSSLVLLLNFLLGANTGPSSIFREEALSDSVFTLGLRLGTTNWSVSRSGAASSVCLVSNNLSEPSGRLFEDGLPGDKYKVREWRDLLRKEMFGLDGPDGPSARSLLSYFVRRVEVGGFNSPFKHHYQQATADYQVAVSFLLDLDWRIAKSWDNVRKREKNVRALSTALREEQLGPFVPGSVAKLRTMVTLAEHRIRKLQNSIDSFHVVEAFSEVEREANELTTRLRQLANENAIDMALIDQLQRNYREESPPDADKLTEMYEAAGVQLGDLVRRRFQEVLTFHESVIRNRARHLKEEIDQAEERINQRNVERAGLDNQRASLLRVLQSGGALSELTAMQETLVSEQAKLEQLRNSYRIADDIAAGKAGVKRARQSLLVKLQGDQRERDAQLRDLIGQFETLSSRLYDEREGSLEIGSSDNGPTFIIASEAGKSRGISNMEVFCFDLLVSKTCADRNVGPRFLVHDSHIFDGVDERQIGRGLALAEEVATQSGFQYIVTMNSDDIPKTLPKGFSIEDRFMSVRLTDTVPEGGLFGFRF